ncbi:MAG: DEAD/DEAH box helicase [Prevotella pallens]|nr:type ISP restriction/modification enzyme [Prevotella pallens]MBF1461720.1 DEAD/DEAH box helicase [Prevotella pallens]
MIKEGTNLTIDDILKDIRLMSITEKEKGTEFERLMQRWLLSDPKYSHLTKVWLWEEFPGRKDFGGKDLGIDLVALDEVGDYYAIQCKCYAEDATIDKRMVDSFLSNASRTFTEDETFQTKEFSYLFWISTSQKKWGVNAEEAIRNLNKRFNRISLEELRKSNVDWNKIVHGKSGKVVRINDKQPRSHQKEAIKKAQQYFIEEGNERGKLIMACGTGKTYTSLKLMEDITEKNALVLFMVPSIALLGQTLNAWMADKEDDMRAICVCSDSKVTRKIINADEEDANIIDLAVPASTNKWSIVRQLNKYLKEDYRTVIFSTYQSIDTVSEALHAVHKTVDLCICDEAHRTTGIKINGQDESNFTKIHSNDIIPAKIRLYMTATPRLYKESHKVKAAENDDLLCSMDDEAIYGKEFYRLSFNNAVSKGLLTDYKVLVLTVNEDDLPPSLANNIKAQYTAASKDEKLKELNYDDATKLIGCINGLSKRIKGDNGITRAQDPVKMKRAVAFCQTIDPTKSNPNASSTQIAGYFHSVCEQYRDSLTEDERQDVVNIYAQHVDGSMDANTRNEKLSWLKAETDDPNECRVLCNVRCLSEGVDVPALDAVLFLSPRNSEVEVVQSVGRVMRTFGKNTDKEKKYGYIIIPVIVPADVKPEDALNDNERFKVVWTILNALRSHDENFNAHVNQINLNKKRTPKVVVGGVPTGVGEYSLGSNSVCEEAISMDNEEVSHQLELRFGTLQDGIYARIVEKVGDKMYWENWSAEIGQIAIKFIERITRLIHDNNNAAKDFEHYLDGLQKNINPSVDEEQAIEMLAQHMITRPIFDALFKEYQFVHNNVISRSMQAMIETLQGEGFEMDTEVLDKFYTSVKNNVSNIDNLEGKQTIIKNIYEKFFKGAFPKTVDKLGIVYTPVDCVDFIIRSVDDILREEFNTSLTEENVHILDPFTGTGTFITRLLQLGVISPKDMKRKYEQEIHCNEIVLLAYYIADVNIESVYQEQMHPDKYLPYNGICLTDTFELNESGDNDIFSQLFPENSTRVIAQKKAPIRVVIGNPPYSVGQKSANDNAQNLKYDLLDRRIEDTYVAKTSANLPKSLYDSYVKAFRWASDRISKNKEGGIVAFISNGAWLDGNAQDGMRQCLEEEFSSIYVLNLRGNQRTSGELSRKEGGKIFGSGSRTPITITFLVKNPARKRSKAKIFYHDIGDYLTREQKLSLVKEFKSVANVEWKEIKPTEKNDWINQRDDMFDTLLPLIPEQKFNKEAKSLFSVNGPGVATGRDVWVSGFSKQRVSENMQRMIDFYNKQIGKADFTEDTTKISWTRALKRDMQKGLKHSFNETSFVEAVYRPFNKTQLYYHRPFIESPGIFDKILPEGKENLVICFSAAKTPTVLITNIVPDYHYIGDTQCFPLYWYEENKYRQRTLFDSETGERYIRRDGITNWILKEVRSRYHANNITKEHIFYYVYGLLHSEDYRTRFAADLKKSLPRIPIVEDVNDFMAFYKAGRKLADLHLNYEKVEPCKEVVSNEIGEIDKMAKQDSYEYFHITDKMRFKSKQDKSTIVYNEHIVLTNIPEKAYRYIVNGKSAIEWIMERYQVKTDKKSLIKNDCNDWAREHNQPRYIFDLLQSVINLSIQTVDIVESLPKLKFDN